MKAVDLTPEIAEFFDNLLLGMMENDTNEAELIVPHELENGEKFQVVYSVQAVAYAPSPSMAAAMQPSSDAIN